MKPMLFNTEMVRAILDGRKTCTRRVAFPNGDLREFPRPDNPDAWWFRGRAYKNWDSAMVSPQGVLSLCKYKKGGILYVRETWKRADGRYFYCADFDSDFLDPCETISGGYPDSCRYYPECIGCTRTKQRIIWRPSIHMPKEAARIFLRVTDVRVERLQEITDAQALLEGVPDDGDYPLDNPVYCPVCEGSGLINAVHPTSLGYMEVDCPYCDTPVKRFSHLWDRTIKPADRDRYGWGANPWVWVIGFEKIEKEAAV